MAQDPDNDAKVQSALLDIATNSDCLSLPDLPTALSQLEKPGSLLCIVFDDSFQTPESYQAHPEINPNKPAVTYISSTVIPLAEPNCMENSFSLELAHEITHQFLYRIGASLQNQVLNSGYKDPDEPYVTSVENEFRRGHDMCLRDTYTDPLGVHTLPSSSVQKCACDANNKVGPLPCNAPGADPNSCGCPDQPDAICCGGRCQDQNDPLNCGSCSNICSTRESCCDKQCVQTNTDAECGGCGISCTGATHCCGASCIDTSNNNDNCGSCGNPCTGGNVCVGGTCQCPSGQTLCNGVCCNGTCSDGLCCPNGFTNCLGRCVDLQTDLGNCGRCGFSCSAGDVGSTRVCSNGACECKSSGDTCYGAFMINGNFVTRGGYSVCWTSSSSGDSCDCGVYHDICPGGASCLADRNGQLSCYCPCGQAPCLTDTVQRQCASGGEVGKCIDVTSDSGNCGGCGRVCPVGSSCANGICLLPDGHQAP